MLPVLGSIGTDLRKHDYLVDLGGGKIEFRFFAWIWSIWGKIISVFRVDLGKVNFGFFAWMVDLGKMIWIFGVDLVDLGKFDENFLKY